jgi:SAM-dependent methyltransferase
MKKPPLIRKIGRWVRRAILKNKSLYFLSRSPKPLSDWYGFDRGTPLDRFYIENFLNENQAAIKGSCLELQDNAYTLRFGKEKVTSSSVLDINKENKNATLFADLRNMPEVASNTFDCVILTQVLQFIDDPRKALGECFRVLKPGGTLLATLPALSRIDCQSGVEGDFWRFTKAGTEVLFKADGWQKTNIQNYGNCRSGLYFLAGVSQEEASEKILTKTDENFPLIITVVALK